MLLRKWRNYERGCIPAPFLQSLTPTSRAFVKHFYSVFRKSDAKIEITIMRQILSELNILSAALIITFLVQTLQISTKSTAQFLSNSCLKNGTQKQTFPVWKSRLSSSYAIPSVNSLCSKWSLFAQTLARLFCRPYVLCCCRTSCLQTL